MRYLVIYKNNCPEYTSFRFFNSRLDADYYLNEETNSTNFCPEFYSLYEITQEFDVRTSIDKYREKKAQLREQALAKLSEDEKLALGLTNS